MQTYDSNEWLHFEWAVRALAQPADVQLRLFPTFVCVADELALDFDEWLRVLTPTREFSELPAAPAEHVRILEHKLAEMSDRARQESWTDEALRGDLRWAAIRERAMALVRCMGWSEEPPPDNRATYVRG